MVPAELRSAARPFLKQCPPTFHPPKKGTRRFSVRSLTNLALEAGTVLSGLRAQGLKVGVEEEKISCHAPLRVMNICSRG